MFSKLFGEPLGILWLADAPKQANSVLDQNFCDAPTDPGGNPGHNDALHNSVLFKIPFCSLKDVDCYGLAFPLPFQLNVYDNIRLAVKREQVIEILQQESRCLKDIHTPYPCGFSLPSM